MTDSTSPDDRQAHKAVVGTGRWIAAARAQESARADRLFNDPWAGVLAGESGRASLDAAPYNPYLPVRTRYFDDLMTSAARPGAQIVLLGAGMDTRAFRLPLPPDSTVYEIDHAEAFDEKESILQGTPPGCERKCVYADLSGPWREALLDAGFDQQRRTIWVAEGLLFYLAAPDVETLVRDTGALSAPGSQFLADTFGTGLLELESMGPLVAARKSSGKPLPFCTDAPQALFTDRGWTDATTVQPGQPEANYGRFPRGTGAERVGPANLRTYLVTATR
ncbi:MULTISPECIES: SAM-dependent methyltransferase [unclassified Arthrobacter]|uniref:SAM-dependent methyltransferase n=1 Tax=unclassified Arthrobacter TaxID=235627 RepID=UPI00254FA06C|nr:MULTISPECIES: SAM-dependent methyltransferase [unclassified Arthrobacter]